MQQSCRRVDDLYQDFVVCGALELYCITLRHVSRIQSTLIWYKWAEHNINMLILNVHGTCPCDCLTEGINAYLTVVLMVLIMFVSSIFICMKTSQISLSFFNVYLSSLRVKTVNMNSTVPSLSPVGQNVYLSLICFMSLLPSVIKP